MPCARKNLGPIGTGRGPDLDPRGGEKGICTRPSVGIVGGERSGSRFSPVRCLGPVLQTEVLDACEGKRRLATKALIGGCNESLLSGRIGLSSPQIRIASTIRRSCRVTPRNFLSGGIVGIARGQSFQNRQAIRTLPGRR